MSHRLLRIITLGVALCLLVLIGFAVFDFSKLFPVTYHAAVATLATSTPQAPKPAPKLDKAAYDKKLLALAHISSTTQGLLVAKAAGSLSLSSFTPESLASSTIRKWPTRHAYPNPGALLPFKRIIAYYGNFYSKQMGVLGEYEEGEMLAMLKAEMDRWNEADPTTPTVPAINYIAVTAQGSPGKSGMYRLRMPDSQIDKALEIARKVEGIVILDVQVGLSTLKEELPELKKYLAMPEVHLGLDPEFSMKGGQRPGTVIGTFDAEDINFAIEFLSELVQEHSLPPKVLVVHRFTEEMVTNYQNIKPTPEVQVVMDMDGWGFGAKKINTYRQVITPEPVQFAGFKLFYKNDIKEPSTQLLMPQEILNLTPAPSFIQYQ